MESRDTPIISNNVVSMYKYIGLVFTSTLFWRKAKLTLVAQANKSIFAIKSYQKKFGYFVLIDQFKLFDSMVKPILLYGGDIWGYEYADEIEKVQIRFCKDFYVLDPQQTILWYWENVEDYLYMWIIFCNVSNIG